VLIPKARTAADFRLQAAHIREFLETVRDDEQLRAVLLDAATRLDQLADAEAAFEREFRKAAKENAQEAKRSAYRRVARRQSTSAAELIDG
jgi:hypothetical protein